MDPRDPQRALPDGLTCTVCHEAVPSDRIRLLARREDLTFVQVDCQSCGSTSLEFVADDRSTPPTPVGSAISPDDVFEMHEFLARWDGDVRTLVAGWNGPSAPVERSRRP